jgi:exopolyphosphatase/guanosine-5'-triphosphate,3'-diphosphate pyrophosphatase
VALPAPAEVRKLRLLWRTRYFVREIGENVATEIIPRWEWRTFGDNFHGANNPFAPYQGSEPKDSDEIYFLSPATSENVKVRDGLMDIKKFQLANADGLEQWKPVMKHGFPLPSDNVKTVFEILGVAVPQLVRSEYTQQQLVHELMKPAGVRVVNVHKTRTRYTVEGCMAELADVTVDGKKTTTIAMELEDAAQVIATVRKLGLQGYENVSYPKGLKRLVAIGG